MVTVKAENAAVNNSHRNGVREQIRVFLLGKFPAARKRGLSDQDHLIESGVLDSLGILEVVGFLEHDFAITITDDELLPENFRSIETLAAFIGRKQNQAPGEST